MPFAFFVVLVFYFVFLTENTVHFGKVISHNAIEKALALFKVIYVSQLFILPLIL